VLGSDVVSDALCCELGALLNAPCEQHAGPALLGLAIQRARLELALRQTGSGRFVQTPETRGLLNGLFNDLAIDAYQEFQLHSAFFL